MVRMVVNSGPKNGGFKETAIYKWWLIVVPVMALNRALNGMTQTPATSGETYHLNEKQVRAKTVKG
jgi:hypothetical protein